MLWYTGNFDSQRYEHLTNQRRFLPLHSDFSFNDGTNASYYTNPKHVDAPLHLILQGDEKDPGLPTRHLEEPEVKLVYMRLRGRRFPEIPGFEEDNSQREQQKKTQHKQAEKHTTSSSGTTTNPSQTLMQQQKKSNRMPPHKFVPRILIPGATQKPTNNNLGALVAPQQQHTRLRVSAGLQQQAQGQPRPTTGGKSPMLVGSNQLMPHKPTSKPIAYRDVTTTRRRAKPHSDSDESSSDEESETEEEDEDEEQDNDSNDETWDRPRLTASDSMERRTPSGTNEEIEDGDMSQDEHDQGSWTR